VLTTLEIQEHLRHVTYKPGWSFTAYDGRWEGQHIIIDVVTPDAFNPGHDITLDVHTSLPPLDTIRELDRWLLWRLMRIESHELREWYKVDGKVIVNPHSDDGNHDVGY
jgi:hypothetical protein